MWKLLLYKWFGLEAPPCQTCEVLRLQLDESNRERKELLQRLLYKEPEPLTQKEEEPVPITPHFVPWRIRQQMLEEEDRKKAQLMREKTNEINESRRASNIAELEKELGVAADIPRGPSGGVQADASKVG